jgi:hypothetical protein
MSGTGNTGLLTLAQLDVEAVEAAIREALRRRSEAGGRPAPSWSQFEADLEVAEGSAQVGLHMPELPRFRGVRRVLARLLVRCILYLSRPITSRQRHFNASVLSCLYALMARARRAEEADAEPLARLEAMLAEQAARIRELEQALAADREWRVGPAAAAPEWAGRKAG